MVTGSHFCDYLIFVTVSSIGVLQLAGANTRFLGLSFFRNRFVGYFVGAGLVIAGFWWFFGTDARIGHDIVPGAEQYGLFIAGIAAGIVATLVLSSLINSRRAPTGEIPDEGIEALESMTYFQVIARRVRRIRKT